MALNQLDLPLSGGNKSIYDDDNYDAAAPTTLATTPTRGARPRAAVAVGVGVLGLLALTGRAVHYIENNNTAAPARVSFDLAFSPIHAAPKHVKLRGTTPEGARTEDLGSSPQSGAYFVTLDIGTPPRPFRVHLDTGSSSLFIPASYDECATCDPHFDRAYAASASSTAVPLPYYDAQCGRCTAACGNPAGRSEDAPTQLWLGVDDVCASVHDSTCTDCLEHDTCKYKGDGECDDGSQGGTQYCDVGTDSADCSAPGVCCESHCRAGADSDACAFQAAYGDESGVSGKVYSDMIALGIGETRLGATAFMGVFDKVHMTKDHDMFEEPDLDGIFGVAGGALNDGRVPVLDEILAANNMNNVFGLCLGGVSGTTSSWDVGAVDPAKYVGDLMKVPFKHGAESGLGDLTGSAVSDFAYYSIDAPHKTTLGGKLLDVDPGDYAKDRTVMIDSGTTYMMLSTPVFNAAVNAIKASASASAVKNGYVLSEGEGHCFRSPEDYNPNADYPVLSFWVKNVDGDEFALEMAAQHYLGAATQPGVWCLGLADAGSESIFGGMFMEAFYTSFDRTNYELGFAPVSSKCGNHLQGTLDAPAKDNWIYGCTDPSFAEYDSAANAAAASACVTRFVVGCLDRNYEEYSPRANRDTIPSSCCTCVSDGHCAGQPGEGCAGVSAAPAPTLDQLAAACPSEFAACQAAVGCEDALTVALSGSEPDTSSPGIAELQALATCLNGHSGGGSVGRDSCRYAFDHECDDGSQGGTQYCATGTDTTDCAETAAHNALSRGSSFMKQIDLVSTFGAHLLVQVASAPPRESTFVCMYECTGGEPADYDPSKVHTVGGCQATPCSAFGQEYCGVWGGQASEAFELPSQELCDRYVETMKPVPVQQRAAAFHVTVAAVLNKAADAGTATTRRTIAGGTAQLSFEKLRAALPTPQSAPDPPAELDTCEEIVSWAKDRVRQAAEHGGDFVCDADAICPHFDGDHARQCQQLEKGLHMHVQSPGSSLCGWVKHKMEGDNADFEAIPQVMCTELLSRVDEWLGEGADIVHHVLSNGSDDASLTADAVWVADKAEKLACHHLLPHCDRCCEVITEVLDETLNPWLVEEGRHLVQTIEDAAARFWHWLCDKIHQL